MIIDPGHFIAEGQSRWNEFDQLLTYIETEPKAKLSIDKLKRFQFLYERTMADLAKISTFSAERETQRFLESLIARAYGEIHENNRGSMKRFSLKRTIRLFPQTVRKHSAAMILSLAIFMTGCLFGGFAVAYDDEAKAVIMPFSHLLQDPSERVKTEEESVNESLQSHHISFSSQLMTHNTKVSIFSMASGMTYGVGTAALAFYNGVIMGAVATDYVLAEETEFLIGWLLPHGSIEIPAILIAIQAGFIIAGALIGDRRGGRSLRIRLSEIRGDIVVLICGVAIMLVWAGIIESFFSQYHEPTVPYSVKICFGEVQLLMLVLFLIFCGRTPTRTEIEHG